jgi:hypothetical protein
VTSSRRRARLLAIGTFVGLISVGAVAMAFNGSGSSGGGLLPPPPEEIANPQIPAPAASAETPPPPATEGENGDRVDENGEHEKDAGEPPPPGTATLAGEPESVVRRFASIWANRNTLITPAIKREMIGLSAGSWAAVVFKRAQYTLPAIEGVKAEGAVVMMKFSTVGPDSKTALVLIQERLRGPDGTRTAPRYELYLARVDRVVPGGYAITAWEPQR